MHTTLASCKLIERGQLTASSVYFRAWDAHAISDSDYPAVRRRMYARPDTSYIWDIIH